MGHIRNLPSDFLCFSHLRWNFVFQRPQHLLSHAARDFKRVFFFEEPVFGNYDEPSLEINKTAEGVHVVQPQIPTGTSHSETIFAERILLDELLEEWDIEEYLAWYYTPMALSFSRHLEPSIVIYDSMDELSLFKHAPKELIENENELFEIADLVFTGGQSLYEAKRERHPNVYAFPSSIDFPHFAEARKWEPSHKPEPEDQAPIPHPRIGYAGVIDERIDLPLIEQIAIARPDWQIVMIGPTAKLDSADLPHRSNIHYLGQKDYKDLPKYMAGWDVAMMPFALNDATKFISPTKTPEYLAAGRPVVSTAIRDVVRPYGELELVHIANSVDEFITAAASAGMDEVARPIDWLKKVDAFLAKSSWNKTWDDMARLISTKWKEKEAESEEINFLIENNGEETAISPEVA